MKSASSLKHIPAKYRRSLLANFERNHQGLDNERIEKSDSLGGILGAIKKKERLGGLLRYYYREAA